MPPVKHGLLLVCLALLTLVSTGVEAAAPTGLPAVAADDTVRTNLWLTEALMAEIVTATTAVLPPAPGAIRLAATRDDPRNVIFQTVAVEILAAPRYELYITDDEPARQAAVDYVYGFDVLDISLAYPDVGRTLGIWRRWVARELSVSVNVSISAESTGRIMLNERMVRQFGDRFDSDEFGAVDSDIYDFTTAETSESGWKSRAEEIVVLGTLVGLVAIYFANTGD